MPNPKQPHYIIAMGAGGINEINRFFDQTPGDDVSYIILEDLSPDFKSRMAVLLAGHSRLQVKEAEDNMWVECNRVYLIPGNKYMIILNGRLHLINKEKKHDPHLNIDKFFTPQASASDSILLFFRMPVSTVLRELNL